MANSTEYNAWVNMKQRCYNKNHPEYFRYGARGITVCDNWLGSFSEFLKDMGNKPSCEMSLERKNNSLGYFPENCVWDHKSNQSFNQRISIDNSSGVTGVYLEKQTSKWKAYIKVDGKQITLGRFSDFEYACKVRKEAELKYYGKVVNA